MFVTRAAVCRKLIVWLAAIFTLSGIAYGESSAADDQYGIGGTIGSYPIAMVLTVRDRNTLVGAHYSYASHKKRIPLTTQSKGSSIVSTEPGGARFDLHLVVSQGPSATPLTFYTSTGLVGTWTDGRSELPVKLTMMSFGPGPIEDCVLYPTPPAPPGVHFPQPGCEHTPDKATLDACIRAPFTSDKAATACIDKASRTCRSDQSDMTFCAGNLESYLDQVVAQRLRVREAPMTSQAYQRWNETTTASCEAHSPFSPDGTGYSANIGFCMAGERLRLFQNRLIPSASPIHS